jgi:hypothetical protein
MGPYGLDRLDILAGGEHADHPRQVRQVGHKPDAINWRVSEPA